MYFIDSGMGAAGDMLLSAFIDLEEIDNNEIIRVLESAGNVMGQTKVRILKKSTDQMSGTVLKILHGYFSHVSGREMQDYLEQGIEAVGLTIGGVLARNILDTILQAEMKVHNSTMDNILLHETGSPDTLVDILGIAYFYERLGLKHETIYGSQISVGQGTVKIAHGTVNVPAPATAEILRMGNLKYRYGPHDGEMTTPTGAAVLSQILQGQMENAPFSPQETGSGFGNRIFDGKFGFLRVQTGTGSL